MNREQKQIVINSHRGAFKRHGYHPNALLWSTADVQELRFKILAGIGIQAGDSVLDIGCGFGDFSAYLAKREKTVKFTGIDLSEDLLAEGRKQFPDIKLVQGDLFDFNPDRQSYDYVILSGTLNRKFDDAEAYTYKTITGMFETCKKGIAFNLLDARHEWTANRWDLQSFHPDEIVKFVTQLTNDYQIIDGYLENDFTVYLIQ